MLSFCPSCNNLLLITSGDSGVYTLACRSCPYEFPIEGIEIYDRKKLPRKEVDDVLGGGWDNVDQTKNPMPQL